MNADHPQGMSPSRLSDGVGRALHAAAVPAASRGDELGSNTAWSAVASFAQMAGGLVSTIVVARALGPTGTGMVAYGTWLAATAAAVAGFGIPQTAIRFVAEEHGRDARASAELTGWLLGRGALALVLGAAALAPFALLVPSGRTRSVYTIMLVVLYAAQTASTLYCAARTGSHDFRWLARLNFISAAAQVVAVTAGALTLGTAGALAGYALGSFPSAAGFVRAIAARRPKPPSRERRDRMLRFATHTWAASLVTLVVWSRLEISFLDASFGPDAVAMFSVSLTLSQLATQGPMLFAGALLPYFSHLAGRHDVAQARASYGSVTRLLGHVVFPLCFGVAALAPVLVPLLFGARFAAAVPAAVLLVCGAAIGTTATVGSSYMYAFEHSRFIAVWGAAIALLAVCAFALVIPHWGVLGAVSARTAVHLLSVCLGVRYIRRVMATPVPLAAVGRSAVAAALCALLTHSVARQFEVAVVSLGVGVLVMASSYVILVRWMHALDPADELVLASALERLPTAFQRPSRALIAFLTGR
jgi:O-antigen/teichoic acid export membrane protein